MAAIQGATTLPTPPLGAFGRLPREVRDRIYEYYFSETDFDFYFYQDRTEEIEDAQNTKAGRTGTHIESGIFTVSKLMSEEALSMLYSKAKIVITSQDILGLRPRQNDIQFPNKLFWRFDPTRGSGDASKLGDQRYLNVANIRPGRMYPHVFAKFKHVCLDLRLDFFEKYNPSSEVDPEVRMKFKDITDRRFGVRPRTKDTIRFHEYMQETELYRLASRVLQNSTKITCLELRIGIHASCPYKTQDVIGWKVQTNVAEVKMFELFLDTEVMDPLLELRNVQDCKITAYDPDDDYSFDDRRPSDIPIDEMLDRYMDPEYIDIMKEMEKDIAMDFEVPDLEMEEEELSEDEPEEPEKVVEISWEDEPSDDNGSDFSEVDDDDEGSSDGYEG